MANLLKISIWAALALFLWSETAEAIALNRCVRVMRDQVGRETLVNTCTKCVLVKIERRRPGNPNLTPTMRDFTVPRGAKQPLSFRGPGKTRIMSEMDCHALPPQSVNPPGQSSRSPFAR